MDLRIDDQLPVIGIDLSFQERGLFFSQAFVYITNRLNLAQVRKRLETGNVHGGDQPATYHSHPDLVHDQLRFLEDLLDHFHR